MDETGQEDILKINVTELKKGFKFCRMDDANKWKVELIQELVNVKQGTMFVENEDHEDFLTRTEIDDIVNYVAAS